MTIAIGLVALVLLCWLLDRAQRIYWEIRRGSDTLERCRVLLHHIAENMQRGPRVDASWLISEEEAAKLREDAQRETAKARDANPFGRPETTAERYLKMQEQVQKEAERAFADKAPQRP